MKAVKRSWLFKSGLTLFGFLPFLYPVVSPRGSQVYTEDVTIVALGDSNTWGYPNGHSWTHIVSQDTGLRVLNRGVNGATTADMLRRVKSDVLTVRPSICIIMGGTNDADRGHDVDEMFRNIQRIANELLANNVLPVIGLPIPLVEKIPEEKLQDLRDRLTAAAFITVDFSLDFDYPFPEIRKYLPDGLHPIPEGKKWMAARLEKELPRILEAYTKFRK